MPKPTEQQARMFDQLRSSPLGTTLAGFLEHLCDELCDIRTMDTVTEDDRRGRLAAVKIIQEHLIQPIRRDNVAGGSTNSEYV